jgi:D-alanyl-D-alanine carboxypeptidase
MYYMKKVLPVFLLLFSISSYCQDIRKVADSIRRYRRVPALAYAIVSGDSIYQMGAVGYKKLRTRDTIAIDNRFHLGSSTASLTGFIAAKLVDDGKITWNTTLFQLFPDLKAKANKDYGNPVFADVLSHRAGFPLFNNYLQLSKLPGFPGPPPEKRKTTVGWLLEQKRIPADSSGKKRFVFSNANTLVAAAMMEKASGKSWESLLEDYINKPLGISVKLGMPSRVDINEPWGHWIEGGYFSPLPPTHWFGLNPSMAPAADANISLPDYIKFVQDELRGLNGMKAMLPKRSYEMIHYGYPVYSFGWLNLEVNGNHISESDGTIGTFYSHVEIIKEKNVAVIVMANGGDTGAKGAVLNLARALREMYVRL